MDAQRPPSPVARAAFCCQVRRGREVPDQNLTVTGSNGADLIPPVETVLFVFSPEEGEEVVVGAGLEDFDSFVRIAGKKDPKIPPPPLTASRRSRLSSLFRWVIVRLPGFKVYRGRRLSAEGTATTVTDITEAGTLQIPLFLLAGGGRCADALSSNPPHGPWGWVKLVDLPPN